MFKTATTPNGDGKSFTQGYLTLIQTGGTTGGKMCNDGQKSRHTVQNMRKDFYGKPKTESKVKMRGSVQSMAISRYELQKKGEKRGETGGKCETLGDQKKKCKRGKMKKNVLFESAKKNSHHSPLPHPWCPYDTSPNVAVGTGVPTAGCGHALGRRIRARLRVAMKEVMSGRSGSFWHTGKVQAGKKEQHGAYIWNG